MVVAPSSSAICSTSAVNSASERVASIGENSTSSHSALACATEARARPLTSSRVDCSWCSMWMSEVDRNVWIRGRSLSRDRLPRTIDVGGVGAGQAADDRAVDLAGDRPHGLEVARRGDREAGLDDVHAEARELLGDLELLGRVERDARRLLAVAQRRVEQQDAVRVFGYQGHVVASPFSVGSCTATSSGWFAASGGRHALLIPLAGEEKKSEVEQAGTTWTCGEPSRGRRDPRGNQHDLAHVLARAPMIRCASGASANGTAAWTTGWTVPSASAACSGVIHGSSVPRSSQSDSMFSPMIGLGLAHLLDEVEAAEHPRACGSALRRLRFSSWWTDEAPKATSRPPGRSRS